MRSRSATVRYLERLFRRGSFDEVCELGDAVGATLSAGAGADADLARVALLVGASHAASERLTIAEVYLESGLDRWAPHDTSAFADWCALVLCDVQRRTGHADRSAERLDSLSEPGRDIGTRFAATRGLAALATIRGDHASAHHLLNSAAGIAVRMPSRFRAALVERDRAVVLARERRLEEARLLTDRVLPLLVRPVAGRYQRWSRAEGASLAGELARHTALAGDDGSARRFLAAATTAAAPLAAPGLTAHLQVALAVASQASAEPGPAAEAEDVLARAASHFERAGDRAGAAVVLLERGRIAHRRRLDHTARPFYRRAATELRACGAAGDAVEPDELLASLDAGRPPDAHRTR